jgi:hypothetical protein
MGKNYATLGGWIGLLIPVVYQLGFGNELTLIVGMIVCGVSGIIGTLIGSKFKRS